MPNLEIVLSQSPAQTKLHGDMGLVVPWSHC